MRGVTHTLIVFRFPGCVSKFTSEKVRHVRWPPAPFSKKGSRDPVQGLLFLTGFWCGNGRILRENMREEESVGMQEIDARGHVIPKCRKGTVPERDQNRNHFIITKASSPFA